MKRFSQFFSGMRIAELRLGVPHNIEAELLFEEAAELRIRASQLAITADLLISQAEQLALRAAALSERAKQLRVQVDRQH